MSDEEEYDDEDEEEEDEEGLSEEERKKRRLRRKLKKLAEKTLEKSSGGRKVEKGFMDAYSGQENAHKYYKHHDFKFTAEPKDKPPEVKPSGATGEYWKEKHLWYPHISKSEENPAKKESESTADDKLFKFMEGLPEEERREVWNIFYEQSRLEELPKDELARIEEEAKLELQPLTENDGLAKATEPTNQLEHQATDISFSRTIFDPEPTDADILRAEKLRKLGHDRCVPPDSLEGEHDV